MINARQFIAIYNAYLESGLTVRDYCANQHIKESQFFYWQNKLKSQLPPKRGFVPVVFENEHHSRSSQMHNMSKTMSNAAIANHTFSCEITYPNGVCMKLNGPSDLQMLRSLLLLTQQ